MWGRDCLFVFSFFFFINSTVLISVPFCTFSYLYTLPNYVRACCGNQMQLTLRTHELQKIQFLHSLA